MVWALVSFPNPNNHSEDRFQYPSLLEAILAGVVWVWEQDYLGTCIHLSCPDGVRLCMDIISNEW